MVILSFEFDTEQLIKTKLRWH